MLFALTIIWQAVVKGNINSNQLNYFLYTTKVYLYPMATKPTATFI